MSEGIVTALKDLIKYKIVANVDTGDKTLDNMVNIFLISILTFVLSSAAWSKANVLLDFIMAKLGYEIKLTPGNYDHYKQIMVKDLTLTHSSWDALKYRDFSEKVYDYVFSNASWIIGPEHARLYDVENLKLDDMSQLPGNGKLSILEKVLRKDKLPHPIYIGSDGSLLGVIYTLYMKKSNFHIVHQGEKVFKEFATMLNQIKIVNKCTCCPCSITCTCMVCGNSDEGQPCDKYCLPACAVGKCKCAIRCKHACVCGLQDKDKKCKIITSDGLISEIYPDRNFGMFVSKHKNLILKYLNSMIRSLSTGKSEFNGFGTFNLGLMLEGKPGTGKTMLIKSICNHLNRDAYVVDMKAIKTSDDFRTIFEENDISQTVFVFEEFDCVQGIITDRSSESKECTSFDSRQKLLDEKYFKVLSLRSSAVNIETLGSFETELEEIKEEMSVLKKTLTLDTMLTVLDGIKEYRGRVIIATTNHIDKIDSALLRGGRFDLKISMNEFNQEETRELLMLMYSDIATKNELKTLRNVKLKSGEYTPVQILHICQK